MPKNLVIVESPAKAKTISKFLGQDYEVIASMGHIRDLPKSKIGVDIEHDFEPVYTIPPKQKKTVTTLKKKAEDKEIWLATDEDREGEAIAWHILRALKTPEDNKVHRIVFHEITKTALLEALTHPRKIDPHLVDAQQARRVLDRLVGYELSPLLWKKIRYGLSAGRVQSVAVRLIVEREREIKAFKPEEYWSLKALFNEKPPFEASLLKIKGKKMDIRDRLDMDKAVEDLKGAEYRVFNIEEKETKRNPSPPFTTSTLQQEAARKLGFSVKKTMVLAQKLYEGVEVFGENTGLITYMRTDSVNLAASALQELHDVIGKEFGKEYQLDSPRFYKGKKGAQEAHEAIRPVHAKFRPNDVKPFLEKDLHRLYELVWKRTMACQMKEAILKQVGVDIIPEKNGKHLTYEFRATGQTIQFPGFIKVYTEGHDVPEEEAEEGEKTLPKLAKGQKLDFEKLIPEQHFTKPPPRYTEASLVKKLESEGIGRPSTYAPTISTIITRGYVKKEGKQLTPTDTGEVVNDVLVEHFPSIVDVKFTSKMEDELDEIAEGKLPWVPVIREFYTPFHREIEEKGKTLEKSKITSEKSDEICDKCGSPMVIKLGRFGKFLSCSNYPTCKNAKPLDKEKSAALDDLQKKFAHKKCDKCGGQMVVKSGRFGNFLGCSNYPECKNIQPIITYTGVKCQECETGQLIERVARRTGRKFYGCNKFPKCRFATWDKPVGSCEKCETGILIERGDQKYCLNCNPPPAKERKIRGKKAKSEKTK